MKKTILTTCTLITLLVISCTKNPKESTTTSTETSTTKKENYMPQLVPLEEYIQTTMTQIDSINPERKTVLDSLAQLIKTELTENKEIALNFICTHNSRRSHMSQIWATIAAEHFQISGIKTYSGGTESTAFNYRAVEALRRAGVEIENGTGENPKYIVKVNDFVELVCFSKKYDDTANPQSGFIAIMNCSEADKACPLVKGAKHRVAVPYEDPKQSDGTPEETKSYDATSKQISSEMFYLMGKVGE